MKDLLTSLDDLLAALPFNGNKTAIGAVAQLVLPVAAAYFPPLLVAAPVISGLAQLITALGLFHKAVKLGSNNA